MEFLIIAIVTAINLIVIKMKFDRARYEDALFDIAFLVLVGYLFSGSYGGMVVAMGASMVMSIYLFISPPTYFNKLKNSKLVQDIKKEFS